MVAYRISFMAAAAAGLAASTVSASPIAKRGDTSGCGQQHATGYKTNGGAGFSLQTSDGATRTYNFRVPDGYDPSRQYPLIVDYHGATDHSDDEYKNSRYDQYDDGRENFIVVYPQALNGISVGDHGPSPSWEGAPYADSNNNDLLYTTELLAHFRSNFCIDSDRIYASGKSNGGGFVGTLACDAAGGEFAAFAMASAALYTDNLGDDAWTCTPSRPLIPIMESHGTSDGTASYYGGSGSRGGNTPDIESWWKQWGSRDGINADANVTSIADGVQVETWSTPEGVVAVKGIKMWGMGHCWPINDNGADNTDDTKADCSNADALDYTPVVLDWFNSWNINGPISS